METRSKFNECFELVHVRASRPYFEQSVFRHTCGFSGVSASVTLVDFRAYPLLIFSRVTALDGVMSTTATCARARPLGLLRACVRVLEFLSH